MPETAPVAADTALATLLEGARRFAEGTTHAPVVTPQRRAELLQSQHPIATVLGCVDSRVPPELIFDQGVGDLLTVRTAGQSLAGVALGSIEFGVRALGVPLVVVLGHTGCGAVAAALSEFRHDGHLGELTTEVAERLDRHIGDDPITATAGNLAATVDALRHIDTLVLPDGTAPTVVGLLYDMATGDVAVHDDRRHRPSLTTRLSNVTGSRT